MNIVKKNSAREFERPDNDHSLVRDQIAEALKSKSISPTAYLQEQGISGFADSLRSIEGNEINRRAETYISDLETAVLQQIEEMKYDIENENISLDHSKITNNINAILITRGFCGRETRFKKIWKLHSKKILALLSRLFEEKLDHITALYAHSHGEDIHSFTNRMTKAEHVDPTALAIYGLQNASELQYPLLKKLSSVIDGNTNDDGTKPDSNMQIMNCIQNHFNAFVYKH